MTSSVVSSRAWRRNATRIGYRRSAGARCRAWLVDRLPSRARNLSRLGCRPEVPAVDPPADDRGPPLQGGEDRGGRGGDLPLPEPGQGSLVRRAVGGEQAIEERPSRSVQHGGESLHRLALGTAACGDDHPLQDGDPGSYDLVGGELLARQLPEQQGAVVLQGSVEQPAGQLLPLLGARLAVPQVVLDGEEVVGAGLWPPAVGGQFLGWNLQLVGQEADDLGGGRAQVVRAEPQVAECPELEGEAEPAGVVDALVDLGPVRPGERVERHQVLVGDLGGEPAEPSPLGVGEELSRHEQAPPAVTTSARTPPGCGCR